MIMLSLTFIPSASAEPIDPSIVESVIFFLIFLSEVGEPLSGA